ncbi:hypothetical protein [Sedimenticola selenatireducens]|jgi:hypothetical protein|uniref:Uncharacterized protein n=1 Tax=Sedimenticola selenatireducens TaxID=191960 RepID=A0A558DTU5_9GAMM|nr:hypothetical protein [Sedimenticola selenatireducens]TVO77011.1 hypothetical protein FHP88_06205 [Sedimenticola selenatireducens]TVT64454.1 MAG: hypothetical protein FHK78_09450 [Sedimenticola selenatireducens]
MNFRILLILGVIGGLVITMSPAIADHKDCNNPFSHSADYTPHLMRQVAENCGESAIANLFYNRAYHAELLQKFQVINRLQTHQPNSDQAHYQTQRIFIALSEAFARRAWERGEKTAIAQLNSHYDRSIEIAEYQLKGYNVLAARTQAIPSNP